MEKPDSKLISVYEMSDILEHAGVILLGSRLRNDYGNGEQYSSIEVHTIGYIADHPDCTVTELARSWFKTKGAVSQMLKRLRSHGLVEGRTDSRDEKKVLLRLTPKGKMLDAAHRHFDEVYWKKAVALLGQDFTQQQISEAFLVLKAWCGYAEDIVRDVN
ncbi:MAG: MarR family winged helix-turn-helix transcriptional regulator [Clostridiaceae bacterium]|nr:MarR family winged helix-turn-helix transcriptional regulator [Clostridiaceae bacterium]